MTERYTLIVTMNTPITITEVGSLWLESAKKVSSLTNIFVPAQIDTISIICNDQVGCINTEIKSGFQIICVRSPYLAVNEADYNSALTDVLNEFAQELPIILGTMEKEIIEVTFQSFN